MAGNFGNNNQNQRAQVSTSLISFWDKSGMLLKVAGLDSGLQISLWVPAFSPDGSKSYPKEQRFATILTPNKVAALDKLIVGNLLNYYNSGSNGHEGIFTNSAYSTLVEIEVKDGVFSLNMHLNCDPSTRISNKTLKFTFGKVDIVKNYDPATGELEVEPIQADFYLFSQVVRGYAQLASGNIAAHGGRVVNSFKSKQFTQYLQAIAAAVNAQVPQYQNNGYNQNSGYGHGGSQYTNYNTENPANDAMPHADTIEVDSFDGLM